MIKLSQLKIRVGHSKSQLKNKIEKELNFKKIFKGNIPTYDYRIIRRSLDARKKPELFYVYIIGIYLSHEDEVLFEKYNRNRDALITEDKGYELPRAFSDNDLKMLNKPVVIIGDGPAGLFCAYSLSKCNIPVLVVERGESVENRTVTVNKFWESGELNSESNVQFGEGGAGTFSDGKLNTLVKDKSGRNQFVLDTFVKHGAKEEVGYVAKPHVGTDILVNVVTSMRKEIEAMSGEFRFNTKFTDIITNDNNIVGIKVYDNNKKCEEIIEADEVVLAIGHSSRDTFEMLYNKNIDMHQKDFAVGMRIEHPRKVIDTSQYGLENVDIMPAADYKVTNKASNGRSVYSFCMCPGGYVVNASSEPGRTAINGMSYSARNSKNSNAALIVSVTTNDFESEHPLAGMWFQRKLEEAAYKLGDGKIPAESYGEFKRGILDDTIIEPCMKGLYKKADLSKLLSKDMSEALIESIEKFGYTIEGYNDENAILSAIESRTSSPVRIVRDEMYEASIKGLYPCGEGAGYAGGITSAAMDGIRVAEKIMEKYRNE